MRINKTIISILISIGWITTLISCNDEQSWERPESSLSPLVVYANIEGSNQASVSRASTTTIDDQWSIVSFEDGDKIGIFSSGGNFREENGPFDNEELIYDGERFIGEGGSTFSPTYMNGAESLIYYPYTSDISDPGLLLRTTADGEDAPLRCVDMLASYELVITGNDGGQDMALFGKMTHAFAELIIMRGEGFDNPPADTDEIQYSRITAVLSEPFTRIQITMSSDPWSCTPVLSYNSSDIPVPDNARKWVAWKGGNYGITQTNPVGKEAWYVVVPTVGSQQGIKKAGYRSYVDYIELYDNEGHLQRVSGLKLSGQNSKYVDAGWRYPMEITMNELVPTVNPYPITPWGKDTNLTDERKRGINNLTEFAAWVRDYNAYMLDPKNDQKIDALLSYGDKYQDPDGNISWHFYLLSDIDLTSYNPLPYVDSEGETVNPSEGVIILKLLDILDGRGTTLVDSKFVNHKIMGLTKTFIGEMSVNTSNQNNGSLQNLDFIEPFINNAVNVESATGIMATSINGGSVVNCNIIDGKLLNPGGPAGMVSGTMNSGIVRDCTFSGLLVCASTSNPEESEKLVGVDPTGNCTFENNDASDVATE
ncbi:MAG: hypothetical protein J1F38_10185 [Muribaculaceae bacterium]|nr:hypothetical protein [Muribaculaceae bacterium]